MDAFLCAHHALVDIRITAPWLSWSRRGLGTENDKEIYEPVARSSGVYELRVSTVV